MPTCTRERLVCRFPSDSLPRDGQKTILENTHRINISMRSGHGEIFVSQGLMMCAVSSDCRSKVQPPKHARKSILENTQAPFFISYSVVRKRITYSTYKRARV